MNKAFGCDEPKLERFVSELYAPEDEVLREIRARSVKEGLPDIQIAALDARHLEVLAAACGARKAVEIGTLGGYSGVALLRGMGPAGILHTFEIDPKHAKVAEDSFRRAGVASQARIHVGPALGELRSIEGEGPFDLCFIDADKESYADYLDWAVRNLRRGGVIIGDNAFLFGEMGEPAGPRPNPAVKSMRAFHERLARGGEFKATVIPTGEGLAVGVKI